MPQIKQTTEYGPVVFVKTWFADNIHVGKLQGGGYAYLNGVPITDPEVLKRVIPPGRDLAEAMAYFENPPPVEAPKRCLKVTPAGDWLFDDGSPITAMSDILNHMAQGPAQEAALLWWAGKLRQKEAVAQAAATPAGQIAQAMKQEREEPAPVAQVQPTPEPPPAPEPEHEPDPWEKTKALPANLAKAHAAKAAKAAARRAAAING